MRAGKGEGRQHDAGAQVPLLAPSLAPSSPNPPPPTPTQGKSCSETAPPVLIPSGRAARAAARAAVRAGTGR